MRHGLGVFAVHVEDGDLQHAGDVARVTRGAAVFRVGGEADLVVDDEVDGAASLVAGEVAQVQRLGRNALADEGGVAMDEQRHHATHRLAVQRGQRAGGALPAILLGTHAALDHRVHELEVARVEGQGYVHLLAGAGGAVGRVAEVVLHVAATEVGLAVGVFECGEHLAQALLHDVHEHVEPAAVGHAHDDLVDPVVAGAIDQKVHQRDHAFGAFDREALGARAVCTVDELLEHLGFGQLGEHAQLLVAAQIEAVVARLHPLAQPDARVAVLDVAELDADRAAVGLFEAVHHVAQALRGGAGHVDRRHHHVGVGVGEAEGGEVELVMLARRRAEGVDVRVQVAAHAIRVQQLVDARLHRGLGELRLAAAPGRAEGEAGVRRRHDGDARLEGALDRRMRLGAVAGAAVGPVGSVGTVLRPVLGGGPGRFGSGGIAAPVFSGALGALVEERAPAGVD